MIKFLTRSILFVFPLLMLLCFFECRLRTIPNSYSVKKEILEKNLPETETVILGSSHSLYGMNPEFFLSRTLNMAHVSQSLYYDQQILYQYLPRMPKLKTVVVSISFFSLESNLLEEEPWRQFFYKRYYGIPPPRGSLFWDFRTYSLFALYGPWNSLSYARRGFGVNLSGVITPNGWDSEYRNLARHNISTESGKIRLQEHLKNMKPEWIPENTAILEELIQVLQARGIRVIFVTSPVSRAYHAFMPESRSRAMQKEIGNLSQKYRVPYFNYLSDVRFSNEDFFDDDHLGGAGIEKFSRLVNEAVQGKS